MTVEEELEGEAAAKTTTTRHRRMTISRRLRRPCDVRQPLLQ